MDKGNDRDGRTRKRRKSNNKEWEILLIPKEWEPLF